jgi:hypothetical protein
MTALSSYTPFLIGRFTTGQFQYLQPWQSPEDAFNPFDNAYVYRGSIYKRNGSVICGHTGMLRYCNNEIIDTGNGGGNYAGVLSDFPIVAGSMTVSVTTSAGLETFTDNGAGVLTGSLGDSGTIDYTTGAWTLTFIGGRTVAANVPIVAHYVFTPALNTTPSVSPIMAITQWHDETINNDVMVVADQRRIATFNTSTRLFDPVCDFQQVIFIETSAVGTTTGSLTLGFTNLAPYSISITDGTNTITDIPTTSINGTFTTSATLNAANTSTVNYSTGVIIITYAAYGAGVPITITLTGALQGDYFTGGDTNFFNSTNWQPAAGTLALLYLTNNKDRVTTFDGTYLSRIPYSITLAHYNAFTNDIVTTLDVKVYKNRLLFIRPTTTGPVIEPQDIRWSAAFLPRNFIANVAFNGGALEAPTTDWIQSTSFLRDYLICFFQNSTWIFRFTNNDASPFRFDKVNDSRSCNAPYAPISYDLQSTAMGARGLIFCDGNNVDRYDLQVIDLYKTIDFNHFIQCIAQRYDALNQGWMIYPSVTRPGSNDFSDKAIIWNYLENSWSTYSVNLSTIGVSRTFQDVTWADFAIGSGSPVAGTNWEDADYPWDNFLLQDLVPALYGGDQNGIVYLLDQGETDNGTHIDCAITSKRWNPFVQSGERVRFGYVDIYYEINSNVTLQIEFFINNGSIPVLTKFLTLDGPDQNDFAWKRVQINLQGEFLQLRITSPIINPQTEDPDLNDGQFVISGIILWAQSAGRLVPGGFP